VQSEVLCMSDRRAWIATMSRAGARDIYFLPDYHQLYACRSNRCFAYVARSGRDILFYPFVLRPICRIGAIEVSPGLHDIETVYGYTGPAATTDAPHFLTKAWKRFEAWCAKHGVVSEFIRFSPLLRTERFAGSGVDVVFDRVTVEVNLDCEESVLWSSYEPEQRNRVRKALSKGVTCQEVELDSGLSIFQDLYEATMRRAQASNFYLFPQRYYNDLASYLSKYNKLFVVWYRGEPIAAGLFFAYAETIHYHLGGSCAGALHLSPNNLLFHQVAIWGQQRGFKRLHLGGGRSNAADDTLLRFKKRLSHRLLSFHVGRRVHDPAQYEHLCDLWMKQTRSPPTTSYFPAYRSNLAKTSC
jgi:Acetyltransferase (GNAT) domain